MVSLPVPQQQIQSVGVMSLLRRYRAILNRPAMSVSQSLLDIALQGYRSERTALYMDKEGVGSETLQNPLYSWIEAPL